MLICPQCGLPTVDTIITADDSEVFCGRCTWVGQRRDLIFIDNDQCDVKGFQQKLEHFYVSMASGVAPLIGKLLIDEGLVARPQGMESDDDKHKIEVIARVLQAATNGALQSIVRLLAEEMKHGRQEHIRQ